jgi:hypothetical protein
MPGSITMSGGGSSILNANSVAIGIDKSADIDLILEKFDLVIRAIGLLNLQAAPIAQLHPSVVSNPNEAIETPMVAGIPGKQIIFRFSAWYDATPIGGLVEIIGSDGLTYSAIPLIAAKVGVLNTGSSLPSGVGYKIRLTAGGDAVRGYINFASTED